MEIQPSSRSLRPFWTGKKLVVLPAGAKPPLESERIPVWIDSEGSFGTGEHPTTRLCLKVLERHLSAGAVVVDVGTGTGILSIAAVKLGARAVTAVDIDPDAVKAAVHNFHLNGVEKRIRIRRGSIGVILETGTPEQASLVIVNILAGAIEQLFSEGLAGLVEPDGWLVLSGVLPAQTPALRACLWRNGFDLAAQEREQEWVCMLARRPRSGANG